jgi:16S rRNA (guanine(527)-N(7))-methyltransferase RsmG
LRLLSEIPGMTEAKAAQLRRHWQLLVESDDKTDLTRLETTQEIAIKHYLDCAMPLKFTKLPSPLLDIGSGAGFPGLVLKILSPETEVILGEVRPKRTRFLQQVIDELGLTGVQVFAHRIGRSFRLRYRGWRRVRSRAAATLSTALHHFCQRVGACCCSKALKATTRLVKRLPR